MRESVYRQMPFIQEGVCVCVFVSDRDRESVCMFGARWRAGRARARGAAAPPCGQGGNTHARCLFVLCAYY